MLLYSNLGLYQKLATNGPKCSVHTTRITISKHKSALTLFNLLCFKIDLYQWGRQFIPLQATPAELTSLYQERANTDCGEVAVNKEFALGREEIMQSVAT